MPLSHPAPPFSSAGYPPCPYAPLPSLSPVCRPLFRALRCCPSCTRALAPLRLALAASAGGLSRKARLTRWPCRLEAFACRPYRQKVPHAFSIVWKLRMHSLSPGGPNRLLGDKECMRRCLLIRNACGTCLGQDPHAQGPRYGVLWGRSSAGAPPSRRGAFLAHTPPTPCRRQLAEIICINVFAVQRVRVTSTKCVLRHARNAGCAIAPDRGLSWVATGAVSGVPPANRCAELVSCRRRGTSLRTPCFSRPHKHAHCPWVQLATGAANRPKHGQPACDPPHG